MKLFPKQNRLLIHFRPSKNLNERIESYRTTSIEKAQIILSKRNSDNIISAAFGIPGFVNQIALTDKKLILSKTKMV